MAPSALHRWLLAGLVLLGLGVASLVADVAVTRYEGARSRHAQDDETLRAASSLQRRLDVAAAQVNGMRAFYDASQSVDAAEFSRFTSETGTGLAASVAWHPNLADPHYAPDASSYPALLVSPAGAPGATLLDGRASAARLRTLLASRDTGTLRVSPPLRLPNGHLAVVFAEPVYRSSVPTDTLGGRRTALRGFVAATYEIATLVRAAAADLPAGAHLTIGADGHALVGTAPLQRTRTVEAGGIRWQVAVAPPHDSIALLLMVAIAGAALLLLVALLLGLGYRREREVRAQRDTIRAMLASLQDGLLMVDQAGRIRDVNDRFCEMVGYDREDLLSRHTRHPWIPADRLDPILEALSTLRRTGKVEADLVLRRRGGELFDVIAHGSTLLGSRDGFVITLKDNTTRKRAENVLRLAADEQAALRRVATAVASETPPEQLFALAAREVCGLLGADATGLVSRLASPTEIEVLGASAGSSIPAFPIGSRIAVSDTDAVQRVLVTGRAELVELPARSRRHAAAPVHFDGRLWGFVTVLSEMTELVADDAAARLERFAELLGLAIANTDARERLAAQAVTDPLTGLPNHAVFHERLRAEVDRAQRHGRDLSVMLFDLDGFKLANDEYGHQAGDACVVDAARRLAGIARTGDLLARIGGDEFALLLPETDALGAYAAGERARRLVGGSPLGPGAMLTVSAGICDLTHASTADELMRYAAGALYWAKEHGRDATWCYSPDVVEELSAQERAERLARQQRLAGIRALAAAVDAKDPSTQRHSERVAAMSVRLAVELGWDPQRVRQLEEAALVHDVGKIGVADAILFKPARLTKDEYEQVKQHSDLGSEIAAEVLSTEQVAWVRGHHERYDGRGYPDGIAGDMIADGAQIMALADSWDVMTSARPYKEPRPLSDSIEECLRCRGSQFAPVVVDALVRMYERGELGDVVETGEAQAA
jgi:diguanylate cyclase (GGDEF)-like protein/PAS domain S-box-containing protein